MSLEERERRLAFLGLSVADVAPLHEFRPVFARHAREFADRFYQHLLNDPHTAALLKAPEQLERLKVVQAEYFAQLLEARLDETYFHGRLQIGKAHQRVGLEPHWYLGAYNQYIQITFPFFVGAFGPDVGQVLPGLLALVKVIFLDIGLALETYFRAATEQLERRNEELQTALDLYWRTQRREEQLRQLANHEVRGGLAAIITGLEDLLDQMRSEQTEHPLADQVAGLASRAWALSNLLRDMLTEPDSAGPAWVDTSKVFASLQARFGLYSAGRQLQLRLPEEQPRVWADPAQLREIFANLVSNSVRYMDKNLGVIEIACCVESGFARFGVSDNGPGIPPEVRSNLFQPFIRGSNQPGGTGLGLYFVRSMVEQNGGQIGVEERPGDGAHFWFTIPLHQ